MSKADTYFTFPLAALTGNGLPTTPLQCLENALNFGIYNAGIGCRNTKSKETFERLLDDALENFEIDREIDPSDDEADLFVGAKICRVTLGCTSSSHVKNMIKRSRSVKVGGPLVRMAAKFFWAAIEQARADDDPLKPWPEHGMSWREFRILAAILSVKVNRAGFSFIGWETIQARSCGFTTKAAFLAAESIPEHLAPPLTHKQIRTNCNSLEALGFYSRFRLSRGSRGGLMAYSFRHDPGDLAKAVCDSVNFRDRAMLRLRRAEDAAKCLELLERAKSGQSTGNDGGKPGGKVEDKAGDKDNEKFMDEKS